MFGKYFVNRMPFVGHPSAYQSARIRSFVPQKSLLPGVPALCHWGFILADSLLANSPGLSTALGGEALVCVEDFALCCGDVATSQSAPTFFMT